MATAENTGVSESSWSNPWIWQGVALALTTAALVWLQLAHEESVVRLFLLLAGLLAAGIGARFTLRGGRRLRLDFFGWAAAESAVLLVLCGLVAFLGRWALWHGDLEAAGWDTLRLVLAVVAVVALAAAPLMLAPPVLQKIVVSIIVLVHFGGILTAVLGAPPGPWFMQMLWSRFYRPYLEFMYLTNAYRFYSPEPGPSSQLWCRLVYKDDGGHEYVRWLKVPETDESGRHTYTIALRNQRRQSLVDNVSSAILTTQPSPAKADLREQQTPRSVLRGVLGQPQAKNVLMIPYYSDSRFPEDRELRLPQYAEPVPYATELLQSYARYLAKLPYPNHPEYRFQSVRIYRAQHRILSGPAIAQGADPFDLTYYLPYYQGQFDARGKLLDPEDPFLYWLVPIMRDDPADRNSPVKAYVFLHAGDRHDWIKHQGPKLQLPLR